MIYRIALLTLFAILSYKPSFADQVIKCSMPEAPVINVMPSKSSVKYDFTKSKAQLNQVDVDTVSPYGPNHKTHISGLMSGSIQLKSQIAFMNETYDHLGLGCFHISKIDIKIHVEPTIFVAKEYPKGSCMHNAILTHEYKHVKEDRLVINKYAHVIGKGLGDIINANKTVYGPFETSKVKEVQSNIQESITAIIKKYNLQMNEERRKRQQAIDTIEEYSAVGAKCRPRRRG